MLGEIAGVGIHQSKSKKGGNNYDMIAFQKNNIV